MARRHADRENYPPNSRLSGFWLTRLGLVFPRLSDWKTAEEQGLNMTLSRTPRITCGTRGTAPPPPKESGKESVLGREFWRQRFYEGRRRNAVAGADGLPKSTMKQQVETDADRQTPVATDSDGKRQTDGKTNRKVSARAVVCINVPGSHKGNHAVGRLASLCLGPGLARYQSKPSRLTTSQSCAVRHASRWRK